MTKFLQSSFSVGETVGLDPEEQQRRWDETFPKNKPVEAVPVPAPTLSGANLPQSGQKRTTADLQEDLDVLTQAIEQILSVSRRAETYAQSGVFKEDLVVCKEALEQICLVVADVQKYVENSEEFRAADIKELAERALDAVTP